MAARRLIRSSSMGQSADRLRSFNRALTPVPRMVSKEQKTEPNQNPPKKVAAVPGIAKQVPPKVLAEKPRKCIFTFPSPPRVEKQRSDSFLIACALCKKKLDFNEDIFMYSDQSYCSPECRDDQITLDEKFNPPSPVRDQQTRFIFKYIEQWKTKLINF